MDNIKKILLTTAGLSSVGQFGGISSYVNDLAENLSRRGHNVTVLLLKQGDVKVPNDVSYNFDYIKIPEYRFQELLTVQDLLLKINYLKPDIIINNEVSYIVGLWPVLDEKIIRISVMHGFSKGFSLSNAGIMGKLAIFNHNYIDYIICQNSQMMLDASNKYSLGKSKLKFIPQSIAIDEKAVEKSKKNSITTIVYAGGMNRKKGAFVALKVMRELKKTSLTFKFFWCGTKPVQIEEFSDKDDRFCFTGNLERKSFLKLLSKSHIIIIPSYIETGPMLLVESMFYGVIPVCNNLISSAMPDLINDGVNGFLIKNNKPQKYKVKLLELIGDFNLIQKLSFKVENHYQCKLKAQNQLIELEDLFIESKAAFRILQLKKRFEYIHFHLFNTSHLPKTSIKRITPKILNAFEIPLKHQLFKKIKYFLE